MSKREWRGLRRAMAGLMVSTSVGAAGCDRSPTETVGGVPSGDEAVADAKATVSPWSLMTIAPLPGDLTLDLSDVNDAGTVVGSSNNVTGSRAFLRIGTTTIPLGTADRSSAALR